MIKLRRVTTKKATEQYKERVKRICTTDNRKEVVTLLPMIPDLPEKYDSTSRTPFIVFQDRFKHRAFKPLQNGTFELFEKIIKL